MLGLSTCTEYYGKAPFSAWDRVTDTFLSQVDFPFVGRLGTVDTFVSIYHRPTRMRNMFLSPTQELPVSNIVRAEDGTVYILSSTKRKDSQHGETYQCLVASRRCDSPSGGKAEIFRPTVSGSGLDLGFVSLVSRGQEYCDTELRSGTKQELRPDDETGQFYMTFSASAVVADGDYCLLNGMYYGLLEIAGDSGFISSRAVASPALFENFYYEINLPGGYAYDPSTGTVPDISSTAYGFSAIRLQSLDTMSSSGEELLGSLRLSVRKEHVGFTPIKGNRIVSGSSLYVIKSVSEDVLRKSWILVSDRIAR